MSSIITNNPNFPTQSQVPYNSILDINGKQTYLGNEFISTIGTVSLSDTAEHAVMYISNPATSKVSLFESLRSLNVADNSGNVIVFRIYSNPTTVSAGSTITPVNCRTGNTNTSSASIKKSPTVGGNGTVMSVIVVGFNAQNIDSTLFILDPGQSMLITAQATAACIGTVETVHYEI